MSYRQKNITMKKNIIKQVKELFQADEEVTIENFVDVKTDDGRILRADAIEVGSAVVEITEDGEVDLEDGEYTLDDGVVLVVSEGAISEVREAEEEEEVVEEVPAEDEDEMAMEAATSDSVSTKESNDELTNESTEELSEDGDINLDELAKEIDA